jgi:hypothetical protein
MHNVRWDGQASVKVNGMPTTSIDNISCPVPNQIANFWGGITGGFDVVTCKMTLSAGAVTQGANTITWYYNGTDGRVAGHRILSFQLIDSTPTNLIPAAEFYYISPSTFTPPLNDPADIAAGQTAFQSAALKGYVNGSYITLIAHCSDCHAKDGMDIRYFNYSPYVIEQRAMFHNLDPTTAARIASYVISLRTPNPGLPWNPPYQPGPGLDSGPISSWSAGAGLSAIAADDSTMGSNCLSGMSSWTQSTYVNSRETCTDLQLPTWNSWLPEVAPQDAWPGNTNDTCFAFSSTDPRHCEAFIADPAYTYYTYLGDNLDGTTYNYNQHLIEFQEWQAALYTHYLIEGVGGYWFGQGWPSAYSRQIISSGAKWGMVKQWELNQFFGLEAYASTAFAGFSPEHAAWTGSAAFATSPNIQHINAGAGLGNGTQIVQAYLSYAWYMVQLILNDGNGSLAGSNPIDYPYVQTYVNSWDGPTQRLNEFMYWAWKALQGEALHYANTGDDPSYGGNYGAAWQYDNPETIVDSNWSYVRGSLTNSQVVVLTQPYLQAWYNFFSAFSAAKYCTGGWISNCNNGPSSSNPANLSPVSLGGAIWTMLPGYHNLGVSSTLITNLQNFGAALYPLGRWSTDY